MKNSLMGLLGIIALPLKYIGVVGFIISSGMLRTYPDKISYTALSISAIIMVTGFWLSKKYSPTMSNAQKAISTIITCSIIISLFLLKR